jgi:uncharacterized alkaline shock family protein YloU
MFRRVIMADNAPPPAGTVKVADTAIISVIHQAVLSCYGVVGMAPRGFGSSMGKRLGFNSTARGIDIAVEDDRVSIELSLIVEYGTPIFQVATNVMQTVKFQVERTLDLEVEQVNVSIDGLHVSETSRSAL